MLSLTKSTHFAFDLSVSNTYHVTYIMVLLSEMTVGVPKAINQIQVLPGICLK